MSRLIPSVPLDEILEKDWQRTVTDLAKQLGWLTYHTHNSRRSAHGFPDLVLVRDRIVYLELKRENRTTSKPTVEQIHWLGKLDAAGAEVYLARPSHLEELGRVLAVRNPGQPALDLLARTLYDELYSHIGQAAA